jgi:hypothetical protein
VSRSVDDRVRDVRRLLAAAGAVFEDRARLAPAIVATTGLSPEGVELGFSSLERDAPDESLRRLAARAGDAAHVHVILSANVFVAPLRALAVARAAAPRVTVHPSRRDPVLTRALVAAADDRGITVVDARHYDAPSPGADGEIHVYGRDETIATVRARAAQSPGVTVRGHGAGLGVAIVTRGSEVEAAAVLAAADVVPFDQRGCLSPRVMIVEGDAARAVAFARVLHDQLGAWADRVPPGAPSPSERAETERWRSTVTFAGEVFSGPGHAVAVSPLDSRLWVPPTGRHVQVVAQPDLADLPARMAPIAPFIVTVGTDDAVRVVAAWPLAAAIRVSALGRMQHPVLDGPVDLRKP